MKKLGNIKNIFLIVMVLNIIVFMIYILKNLKYLMIQILKKYVKILQNDQKIQLNLTQQFKAKIVITDEENKLHHSQNQCNECKCKLSYKKDNDGKINQSLKVKHHDHITGNFINTLCYKCNINFEYKKLI